MVILDGNQKSKNEKRIDSDGLSVSSLADEYDNGDKLKYKNNVESPNKHSRKRQINTSNGNRHNDKMDNKKRKLHSSNGKVYTDKKSNELKSHEGCEGSDFSDSKIQNSENIIKNVKSNTDELKNVNVKTKELEEESSSNDSQSEDSSNDNLKERSTSSDSNFKSKNKNKTGTKGKKNTKNETDSDKLKKYKQYLRAAGIFITNYTKFFDCCQSEKQRIDKIINHLRDKGHGPGKITFNSCNILRQKNESFAELEELKKNQTITGKRTTNRVATYAEESMSETAGSSDDSEESISPSEHSDFSDVRSSTDSSHAYSESSHSPEH